MVVTKILRWLGLTDNRPQLTSSEAGLIDDAERDRLEWEAYRPW